MAPKVVTRSFLVGTQGCGRYRNRHPWNPWTPWTLWVTLSCHFLFCFTMSFFLKYILGVPLNGRLADIHQCWHFPLSRSLCCGRRRLITALVCASWYRCAGSIEVQSSIHTVLLAGDLSSDATRLFLVSCLLGIWQEDVST